MTREINLGNLIIPLIKPQKGIDYYTSAEKQEIVNEVTNNVNDVILPQEEIRQSNEITRQNNENTRQAQETSRTISENERQNAETERIEAESIRQDNESSRESAEQERTETFNTQMQAVNTAIQGIHTSQEAYDQNAQEKTTVFNTNATNKMNAYNTNATEKIAEYDAHVHDYEQELANKVDKVAGKVLSTNDFTNEKSQQIETNKTAIQTNAGAITDLSGRVTEVEGDTVDIQEEQAEQNESITENKTNIDKLKSENETLKSIINQMPQVEDEGYEATLNNTIKAPFTKFDVEGHSEQETTEGYQLLPNVLNSAYTNAGITFTPYFNERGDLLYVNVNGTATGTAYYDLYNNTNKRLIDDTTSQYTFTLVNNVMIKQIYERIDGSWSNTYSYSSNTAYTPSEGSTGQLFRILVNSGTTLNNEKIYPMVYKGSYDSSKTYEPFTYGASPNPSYEQPIKSAGENVNLFDKTTVVTNKYINNQGKEVAGAGFDTSDFISVIPNSNIVLSGNNFIQSTHGAKGAFYNTNKEFVSYVNIAIGANVYAVPNTAKYFRFSLKPNDLDIIKVEKGSTATPWSPYGMGSITDKIINKNWFDGEMELGTLGQTGQPATTNNSVRTKNFQRVLASTTYAISNDKSYQNVICLYDKNKNFIERVSGSPSTFTTTADTYYAKWRTSELNVENDTSVKFQLEIGLTASSYIPHEEQTYSIYTQQPMRSIRDVRDVFFKNTVDSPYYDENLILNGWYERHNINRKIFDGTEEWTVVWADAGPERYGYRCDITNALYPTNSANMSNIKSNYYITYSQNKIYRPVSEPNAFVKYGVCIRANYSQVLIKNNDYTTISAFTTYLATQYANGKPLYVDYLLETPQNLPCTQSQIDILENIPSTFSGQTNVFSIDEVKAYLRAKGLKDLNTLDSEINNVKQAIVALGGVV